MMVARDNQMNGLLMIPIWQKYNLHRCNVRNCTEKQTTLVLELAEVPFALCESHYNEFSNSGEINCTLDFD